MLRVSTGASFCFIAGHEVPFSKAVLQRLYPTHDTYVKAVQQDVDRQVRARFITTYDGQRLIAEAQAAKVP